MRSSTSPRPPNSPAGRLAAGEPGRRPAAGRSSKGARDLRLRRRQGRPATRTGAHHDPATSGWFSRRTTTKGNSTTAEVLPKTTPKHAASRRPPMLTPSPPPEPGACKAFAPLVTARPPVLPVGTTLPGALHASHQPTEGPPALSTTCLAMLQVAWR